MSVTTRRSLRQEKAARTQSVFREVNERVGELNGAFGSTHGQWLCECADEGCSERIEMSTEEYARVRSAGTHFAVVPDDGHVLADLERVLERHEQYWVLAKIERGAVLAQRLDPHAPNATAESYPTARSGSTPRTSGSSR